MNPDVRLTLRSWLPVIWLILITGAALLLPGRVWNTLLVALGGLLLVSYIWARQLARHVRGDRRLRFGWVAVGDRLSEQFEIRNASPLPAFWVEVVDHSNVPGYRPAVVRSAGGGQTERWRQSAICTRRGQFQLGPWSLVCGDPFGLFRVRIPYPISDEIIIHPPIHTHLPIPLPAGRSSGRARARERSLQATINAATVREYRPGDPMRHIHWRTSARQGKLQVREFDLDAAGDIWLVLDLQADVQLGREAGSTEEHAVLLAASLGARGLEQNRGVGLAAYGRQPRVLPPAIGRAQEWALLRNLALVNADGDTGLARALTDLSRVAQRGSAAVVITPRADAAWLPALWELQNAGVQGHAILLERASFGGIGNSHAAQEAIRRAGFACHLLQQGDLGRPVTAEEGRGFWEFKTTPTGKVVVLRRPEPQP